MLDIKDIITELEAITRRGYNARGVFEDWITLMFYALQHNDEEYLKIVNRYRNEGERGKREIDHFANAFGLLMEKMSQTNRELLGEIYMQWEVSNKYSGQFFTPWHIAQFMAQLTAPKNETISDPTCGSGVMLIASCKTMTNEELDKAIFVGQDLDFTCVMMCALNLTFFNLNGYVLWGDTLAMERKRVFRTARSYMGGTLHEIDPEEIAPQVSKKMPEAAAQSEILQPSLF